MTATRSATRSGRGGGIHSSGGGAAGGGVAAAAVAVSLLACALAFTLSCAGCSAGGLDVVDLDPRSRGNGLVAHWSFDDGVGGTLADRSGHGNDGTIIGGTWLPPGQSQFGGALHFDASAFSEVSVPLFPQPQPQESWSVAAWVRPPSGDFGVIYRTLISTEIVFQGGWEMNVRLAPPSADAPEGPIYQFAYWIGPGESTYVFVDCACVVVGAWTHLAAVTDRQVGKLSLYVNGRFRGEMLAPAGDPQYDIHPGDPTLYMARWAPDDTRDLTGDLDDVVIYNRALGPREIEQLARAALPPPPY